MKNTRGSIIILVTIFIAVLLLGGVGYGYLTDWNLGDIVRKELASVDPYEDWLMSSNEEYGFSIRYPKDWYARRADNEGSSYSFAQSFSYRKEPEEFAYRINDNVSITVYTSDITYTHWATPASYLAALRSLAENQPQDLSGSLLTSGITVTKLADLDGGGIKVYMTPSSEAATEPFKYTNYYHPKGDLLYEIGISIPQDSPYYKTAIAIAESFDF